MPLARSAHLSSVLAFLAIPILRAQVSNERLLRAAAEPQNWMMYSGTYVSQRYSTLAQIHSGNVKDLEQKWVFQAESLEKFETTPLVVDGIMYITQAPSDALALDAKSGRSGSTGTVHRWT
jgi:alcohol dehydrogenase (cytochrome c)